MTARQQGYANSSPAQLKRNVTDMQEHATQVLPASTEGIARAAALLQSGGLVAFPTETVYGLGGDATNDTAVAGIFAAKNRPGFNPLIVHLPDLAAAERIAVFSAVPHRLASAFWPGPLTLVLPLKPGSGISPLVTAGLNTVAIRIPAHPLAQALLRATARPVAAPSANPSGRISPTSAAHVLDGLEGRIAAVLDGGPCAVGVESTIVGLAGAPVLLRPGGLTQEALEALLGPLAPATQDPARPSAPGQMASHYAPAKPLRLEARSADPDEVWIGFGPDCPGAALNLSPNGDLPEAAANLFACLRSADGFPAARIAVAPIPATGIGQAINDRLRRAAAPRT